MEFLPVNLTEVMGIGMGMLAVLVPVTGLTLRFAVKPIVETLVQNGVIGRATDGTRDVEVLTRRLLELEQEVAKLKASRLRVAELPVETSVASAPPELHRLR